MGSCTIENPSEFRIHPYLQTLLTASVPVDQILREAEGLEETPHDLLATAKHLIAHHSTRYDPVAPLCLALGASNQWEPFVAEAHKAGLHLLVPLLLSGIEPLEELLGDDRWEDFAQKALSRMGFPVGLLGPGNSGVNPEGAVGWLDSGLGLVAHELELSGFSSKTSTWGDLLTDFLVIRDARGPAVLTFFPERTPGARLVPMGPGFPGSYHYDGSRTRLFRVKGLRALEGLENHSALVAAHCPDLESLDATPPVLVLSNCPSLAHLPNSWCYRSQLLHLDRCPRIQSLPGASVEGEYGWESSSSAYGTVVLTACTGLQVLPNRCEIAGSLFLRRMGPFEQWPSVFRIGGDLRIRDCPDIEELPVVEVSGSLRVEGASGLRRLSPGTVIAQDLDLRACPHLEGIPRGVEVGGSLRLPHHLLRSIQWESPRLILDVPVDRYQELRILLTARHFPELAREPERHDLKDRAERILDSLQQELWESPGLEAQLLWTASDVWRDLAAERWGRDLPWSEEQNDSDEDLPLAWFRGLLFESRPLAADQRAG